jgi:hypothetical protein
VSEGSSCSVASLGTHRLRFRPICPARSTTDTLLCGFSRRQVELVQESSKRKSIERDLHNLQVCVFARSSLTRSTLAALLYV